MTIEQKQMKEGPADERQHGPRCQSIRVVIADAYPVVIGGIKSLLEREPFIRVVDTETNPQLLLSGLDRIECDLLVTDLNLSDEQGLMGLRMLQEVRRRQPHLPIVVYTVMRNAIVLRSALSMGASLILKSDHLDSLVAAVKAAARNDRYICAAAERLLGGIHTHPRAPLSRREYEVLMQFYAGAGAADLAEKFNTSIKTVSAQKRSAMAKLGLASDLDISIYLHEHGLSEPED